MNALRKIDKILNRVRSVVLVALLVSMMGMCTMNVVLRYLIKGVSFLRPFSWVNEMTQMLAIWRRGLAYGRMRMSVWRALQRNICPPKHPGSCTRPHR